MPVSFTTYLNTSTSTSSHSQTMGSSSLRVVDLVESVVSHSTSGSSTSARTVALVAAIGSHSTASASSALRVVDLLEAVTSSAAASDGYSNRVVTLLEDVVSHASPMDSESIRVTDVLASALSESSTGSSSTSRSMVSFEGREAEDSHGTVIDGGSLRVIDLLENVTSSTPISAASASRGSLNYAGRVPATLSEPVDSSSIRVVSLLESVGSYGDSSRSFSYNERTSLELIDFNVDWVDSEAVWYTDWFTESRIMGSEDTLAVRSLVVPDAKDPAATVVVQYDEDGNGEPDAESDPVRIGQDESVREITGVPVDETGRYRLKIMEYSGYNSLYAIDTAIVH